MNGTLTVLTHNFTFDSIDLSIIDYCTSNCNDTCVLLRNAFSGTQNKYYTFSSNPFSEIKTNALEVFQIWDEIS